MSVSVVKGLVNLLQANPEEPWAEHRVALDQRITSGFLAEVQTGDPGETLGDLEAIQKYDSSLFEKVIQELKKRLDGDEFENTTGGGFWNQPFTARVRMSRGLQLIQPHLTLNQNDRLSKYVAKNFKELILRVVGLAFDEFKQDFIANKETHPEVVAEVIQALGQSALRTPDTTWQVWEQQHWALSAETLQTLSQDSLLAPYFHDLLKAFREHYTDSFEHLKLGRGKFDPFFLRYLLGPGGEFWVIEKNQVLQGIENRFKSLTSNHSGAAAAPDSHSDQTWRRALDQFDLLEVFTKFENQLPQAEEHQRELRAHCLATLPKDPNGVHVPYYEWFEMVRFFHASENDPVANEIRNRAIAQLPSLLRRWSRTNCFSSNDAVSLSSAAEQLGLKARYPDLDQILALSDSERFVYLDQHYPASKQ